MRSQTNVIVLPLFQRTPWSYQPVNGKPYLCSSVCHICLSTEMMTNRRIFNGVYLEGVRSNLQSTFDCIYSLRGILVGFVILT